MKLIKLFVIGSLAFAIACNAPETQKTDEITPPDPAVEKADDPVTKTESTAAATPTETMTAFLEALKKKDVKTIKASLSKASLAQYEKAAEMANKSLDEFILDDEDDSLEKMPEMRNEKIDGDTATLEVEDPDTKKWDSVPFVKEDGVWKIAFDKLK